MISRLLDRDGKYDLAVNQLRNILEDSAIIANRDVEAMVFSRMAEGFAAAGKKDSAQAYRIKYLELSDSLFATQKMAAVKDMGASHERRKFMTEITRISDTVNFQRRLLVSIAAGVLIAVILLCWIILKNRQLRRSNRDLYARNRELLAIKDSSLLTSAQTALSPDPSVENFIDQTDDSVETEEALEETRGKLAVDSEFMESLRQRILAVMGSDEIFSPDFNSTRLATLCDTNTRYISAALSETEAGNFPSLLAQFRVREAMRRLDDTEGKYSSLTLEAIGEGVGFKTRSTFSTTFKKVTGLTPKQYRQLGTDKKD